MQTSLLAVTLGIGGLVVLSLALQAWQWREARLFPPHQRTTRDTPAPAISLIKPLKGCDAQTRACLTSWLQQDYPGPIQFLFGVASKDDPVCGLVRALAAEYLHLDIHLVPCLERLGPNAKVSTLAQLQDEIAHELILVSDADVKVPHDFLSQMAATLTHQNAALANCFYALTHPANVPMRLEALAINADFWPQVLQSRRLTPLDFALGAAMLLRRSTLEAIGSFQALSEYLADDFQLGHRIARSGGSIALCPVVVECLSAPQSWKEVWAHQLRWARTVRVCRPVPYFFSILINLTLWIVVFTAFGLAVSLPLRLGGLVLMCAIRLAVVRSIEDRLTAPLSPTRSAWWMPMAKDLLQAIVWAYSFLGNTVEWRGERFRVGREGKLQLSLTPPRREERRDNP